MDEFERIAINYLPAKIQSVVNSTINTTAKQINEIRLRLNKPISLTVGRENRITDYICSSVDLAATVASLCQNSIYSYAEYIKEGVIPTEYGIRAGVCGRAVLRDATITCVRDITSINLRIPHRVCGAADALYELVRERGSVLIYSSPGLGKTTLLRELIPLLSSGVNRRRVAVIDTRFELSAGISECETVDIFLGYPRKDGVMSAIRTMSPEYILCDEISSEADREAVMSANSAGINVVASAHGSSIADLRNNKNLRNLIDSKIFGAAYGINTSGYEVQYFDD